VSDLFFSLSSSVLSLHSCCLVALCYLLLSVRKLQSFVQHSIHIDTVIDIRFRILHLNSDPFLQTASTQNSRLEEYASTTSLECSTAHLFRLSRLLQSTHQQLLLSISQSSFTDCLNSVFSPSAQHSSATSFERFTALFQTVLIQHPSLLQSTHQILLSALQPIFSTSLYSVSSLLDSTHQHLLRVLQSISPTVLIQYSSLLNSTHQQLLLSVLQFILLHSLNSSSRLHASAASLELLTAYFFYTFNSTHTITSPCVLSLS
jgi:hypothetical protein